MASVGLDKAQPNYVECTNSVSHYVLEIENGKANTMEYLASAVSYVHINPTLIQLHCMTLKR